jgi:hypothetical protein
MTEQLTLTSAVDEAINSVTTEQLERAQADLDPVEENEALIGTLHSERVRRLFVAQRIVKMESVRTQAESKIVGNVNTANDLEAKAERLASIAKIMLTMFWFECRECIGWQHGGPEKLTIGIRANWMLVRSEEKFSKLEELFNRIIIPDGQ